MRRFLSSRPQSGPVRVIIDSDHLPSIGLLTQACQAPDLETALAVVVRGAAAGGISPEDHRNRAAVLLVAITAFTQGEGAVLRLPSAIQYGETRGGFPPTTNEVLLGALQDAEASPVGVSGAVQDLLDLFMP